MVSLKNGLTSVSKLWIFVNLKRYYQFVKIATLKAHRSFTCPLHDSAIHTVHGDLKAQPGRQTYVRRTNLRLGKLIFNATCISVKSVKKRNVCLT